MNKSQLVDALADRVGDRRAAATAVDALLQILVDTVASGESVSLAGFGVFESRARAARTGRNPRTGETVEVPATTVPAFRPGTGFRAAVADHPAAVRPGTPVTNGAGGQAAGAALHGAVELSAPASSVLGVATAPKAARPAAGAATKSRKKSKDKDAKNAKDKKEKGGKKNKK